MQPNANMLNMCLKKYFCGELFFSTVICKKLSAESIRILVKGYLRDVKVVSSA